MIHWLNMNLQLMCFNRKIQEKSIQMDAFVIFTFTFSIQRYFLLCKNYGRYTFDKVFLDTNPAFSNMFLDV